MKNFFRKKEVANAWGSTAEDAVAKPFRRFVRIVCLVVGVFVLLGACAVSWKRAHSLPAKLEAMENDVSRMLADALAAPQNGELAAVIERGQTLATVWRGRFKSVNPGSDAKSAEKLLRLQALEEDLLPRWRRILSPLAADSGAMPWEKRLRLVRAELLSQQEKWPPPPAPPLRIVLSDGVRKLSEGAVWGVSWPWEAGRRTFVVWNDPAAKLARTPAKLRFAFFPWRLGAMSFPWILGFGAAAAAVGYFLCWIGMKANSMPLSMLGLVYFAYIVVFVVCLLFLVIGVMK